MNLDELMVDTKSAWMPFPGCDGFKVEVAALSRKELLKLRKGCVTTDFDRKTRQPVEKLNEDKFVEKFSNATIKSWKGFKLKYLEELLIINMDGKDPEMDLEYSAENAIKLVSNSSVFDEWLNQEVFNLDNFRTGTERTPVETAGSMA